MFKAQLIMLTDQQMEALWGEELSRSEPMIGLGGGKACYSQWHAPKHVVPCKTHGGQKKTTMLVREGVKNSPIPRPVMQYNLA